MLSGDPLPELREIVGEACGEDSSDLGSHEMMYLLSEPPHTWSRLVDQMMNPQTMLVGLRKGSNDYEQYDVPNDETGKDKIQQLSVDSVLILALGTLVLRSTMLMARAAAIELHGPHTSGRLALNETLTRSLDKGLDLLRGATPGTVEMAQSKILALEEKPDETAL